MNTSKKVRFLALGAVIAALYAVLTYVAAAVNLAYGPVQFRFSEALTVLPVFTPAAIPGLTLGCVIANLGSLSGAGRKGERPANPSAPAPCYHQRGNCGL